MLFAGRHYPAEDADFDKRITLIAVVANPKMSDPAQSPCVDPMMIRDRDSTFRMFHRWYFTSQAGRSAAVPAIISPRTQAPPVRQSQQSRFAG